MKTVSFYSFKGGVGRSLTLVNMAYQLSVPRKQRVGLIDLDIEGGGLNQILNLEARADRDLLALLEPGHRDLSKLEEYILDVPFQPKSEPGVFLLPTVSDSVLLDKIPWDVATQHFLSDELFPALRKLYKLDYLLLDSRSGLSEFATFALKVADLEVLVCRLDAQNRYGIKRIVEVCRAASKPFKVVVSACPDKGREKPLRKFRKAIETKVNYVLPYEPRLYYEELIISKTNPRHRLTKLYSSLAADIHKTLNETT